MKNHGKMRKTVFLLSCVLLLLSCSEQYNIAGNSTIGNFDGQTVYLKVNCDGTELACLDSCQMVHGRFSFMGDVDTVMVAMMYMGNERLIPVVLETGDLTVEMDHCGPKVGGTPYNDKLNAFFRKRDRIENEQWELDRECLRMMREGKSREDINSYYQPRAERLIRKMEKLETDFIRDNYDNALGPGCFLWLFGSYPIPIMTDQIRNIIAGAPPCFLNNPYVNNYVRRARRREHDGPPRR